MAALKYWVWLTTLPGLTEYNKLLLMEHFSSPEDIYYADQEVLWQVEGLGQEQAAVLVEELRCMGAPAAIVGEVTDSEDIEIRVIG